MKDLPFTWFDIVVLLLLVIGLFRGKKRGMSNELLPVMQWLLMIVAAGMFYSPVGQIFASATTGLGFSFLFWYITAYLLIVIAIKVVFTLIKKAVGEKLIGSDLFGGAEFYLGMLAGMIRFGCMVTMALALFNSKQLPSEQSVAEKQKKQQNVLGSNFFPSLDSLQLDIVSRSCTGQFAKKYLNHILIAPTSAESKPLEKQDSPAKKIEREMNETLKK